MARLTLTFDNGPDPATTPGVLAQLAERELTATFFAVGTQVRAPGGRDLLERAVEAGHRIGNHSMTHTVPFGEDPSPDVVGREIVATDALLGVLVGPERLVRPFGGGGRIGPHLFSPPVVDYLVQSHATAVLWNSVPHDWDDPVGWPGRAQRDIDHQDWTVLVLHDLPTGAMAALPQFLDTVLESGVEVVAEFPDDCVPIRRGRVQADLTGLVTDVGASRSRPRR